MKPGEEAPKMSENNLKMIRVELLPIKADAPLTLRTDHYNRAVNLLLDSV